MAEKIPLTDFKRKIRDLRTADYGSAVSDIGVYLGLPDALKEHEGEIILIKTTKDKFGDSLDADIVLAVLGLLDGYDDEDITFPPEAVGEAPITARRTKLLYESTYIAMSRKRARIEALREISSYEELVRAKKSPNGKNSPLDIVRGKLGKYDEGLLEKLAEALYAKRDLPAYLEQAKKEYGIVNAYGRIIGVKYPKLVNVRQDVDVAPRKTDEPAAENTDIAVELTSTEASAPVETQGDFTDKVDPAISPPLRKKQIDSKSILSVLSALVAVMSLVSLVAIWSTYPKQETVINQVSIVEDSVTLEPGRFATLQIDYVPEDADPGILDCSEGYDDRLLFAFIDKLWANSSGTYPVLTIGAREPWDGNLPYDAAVKVKADENICDYVDVTVIEKTPIYLSGNNAEDGTGEKTEVTP